MTAIARTLSPDTEGVSSPTTIKTQPGWKWKLVPSDPDDLKIDTTGEPDSDNLLLPAPVANALEQVAISKSEMGLIEAHRNARSLKKHNTPESSDATASDNVQSTNPDS